MPWPARSRSTMRYGCATAHTTPPTIVSGPRSWIASVRQERRAAGSCASSLGMLVAYSELTRTSRAGSLASGQHTAQMEASWLRADQGLRRGRGDRDGRLGCGRGTGEHVGERPPLVRRRVREVAQDQPKAVHEVWATVRPLWGQERLREQ